MDKIEINGLTLKILEEQIETLGEKKFRAKQIYSWLHEKMVTDFDHMTNLSKELREKLKERYFISKVEIVEKLVSKDNTIKYLFRLYDDNVIESVFMTYKHGYSVCISSQVGCKMGCTFCASTIDGMVRNLSSGEMLAQIYEIQKVNKVKINNIVIMGSGEPLENFDNTISFLEIINSKEGQNISLRNITVSTCGLANKIVELADRNIPITLAISLHAPFDKIREQLMPINKKYKIKDIMEACDYYTEKTKRRITYEYALIKDVNDSYECALMLAKLLSNKLAHVNLIPINNVKERDYLKSNEKRIRKYAEILDSNGINVTIRRELGSDINAACGQLRKRYINKN